LVFFDDILVYNRTLADHLAQLEQVPRSCSRASGE
jgi:hypothetical protein